MQPADRKRYRFRPRPVVSEADGSKRVAACGAAIVNSVTAARSVIAVAGPVAATSQNFPLASAYLAVSAMRCATGRLPWNRHTGGVFYSRPAHSRTWVGQKGRLLPEAPFPLRVHCAPGPMVRKRAL